MICEHTEKKIKMPQGTYIKNIQTFNRNFESLLETQRNRLKGAANPATVFAPSRAWALRTKRVIFLKDTEPKQEWHLREDTRPVFLGILYFLTSWSTLSICFVSFDLDTGEFT